MREDVVRMLGFDAINEFASFVHWATFLPIDIMFPLYMFVTILYRLVSCLFWRDPPPLLFFRTVRSYNTCWRVRKLPSNDLPRPCLHTIKCMQVGGLIPETYTPVGTSTAYVLACTCIHRSGLSLAHPVGMKICQTRSGLLG